MNLDFSKVQRVYFLGIGGIGMSAVARYLYRSGVEVLGYDRESTQLTKKLEAEGIKIEYSTNIRLAKDPIDVVIYTPAIKADQLEFKFFEERGFLMIKRSQALEIILKNKRVIAIAGTHGKTSTSALIAHICNQTDLGVSAFIGGILSGYKTNFFFGKGDWVLIEADEYDRSFWRLYPDIAVINAMDADHLDIYGTHEGMLEAYQVFSLQVKQGGSLMIADTARSFIDEKWKKALSDASIRSLYFGLDKAELKAKSIEVKDGRYQFSLDDIVFKLSQPGIHNVYNTLAAIAVCRELGLEDKRIAESIQSFKGIERRYEICYQDDDVVIIDDYAHHPVELEKTIDATRKMYRDRKLTVVFQPHLYSRTKDLKEGFAKALDESDEAVLVDLYPAREKPIEGISSESILELMELEHKVYINKDEVVKYLSEPRREVILFMGAGDANRKIEELILEYSR